MRLLCNSWKGASHPPHTVYKRGASHPSSGYIVNTPCSTQPPAQEHVNLIGLTIQQTLAAIFLPPSQAKNHLVKEAFVADWDDIINPNLQLILSQTLRLLLTGTGRVIKLGQNFVKKKVTYKVVFLSDSCAAHSHTVCLQVASKPSLLLLEVLWRTLHFILNQSKQTLKGL